MEDRNKTPRKKKTKLDPYPAFDPKQQETLKTYDRLESKVWKILNATYKKLTESLPQDNMLDKIKYLTNRLLTLKKKTSLDPIYIGLIGRTGTGKSSLLNALIDQKFFLPVSGSETCTSCVVQVSSNWDKNYEAKIYLLSDEEWKEELKNLTELLKRAEEEEVKEETDVGEAVRKLQALYGKDAETRSYEDLLNAKPLENIPSSKCISFKEEEAKKLSKQLGPYIRCHNDLDEEEPAQDKERAKTRIWPLIKHVEVTIPKPDVIPEGVMFMDIPGTGDYNKERDEMWKESINKCSVIWVISDTERIVGDKVHKVLLEESIKAYQGGSCSDISLVVTKMDNLDLDEYLSERRRNTPIKTKHDAILERNATVKEKKSSELRKKLQKILPSGSEILHKPDLVYTVSTTEYWKGNDLTKEETEIPKLRDYVKTIYVKEKGQLLLDYVTQALRIVLLAKNLSSTQDTVNHDKESDLEAFVDEKIKALEKNIEKCFAQLEEPLTKGVERAKSSCQNTLSQLLERSTGYRGFHRTLKAVCQRNGVYASRTFARIDLNSAFAQPIYNTTDPIFAKIFRTQRSTRALLKPYLDMFKSSVQGKISEVGKKSTFFIDETDIIQSTLEREISKKRMAIYQSLPKSIQSNLQPHYEAAAKIQGKDCCQKMKSLLKENVEREMKDGMFERAKKEMTAQLQDLKNDIVTKLRTDIPPMIKLALSHTEQLTERLLDLQDEYEDIVKIEKELKSIGNS